MADFLTAEIGLHNGTKREGTTVKVDLDSSFIAFPDMDPTQAFAI